MDKNHTKVSVIIPVYNVEKYLRECLDSVVNQTLKDIEIIIIDDGSTDKSAAICDEYAEKDSRIIVVHKENSGYGASMNIGLKKANGEYIGIVESDDFVELEMFEKLYDVAKENDLDIARCNFFYYNSVKGTNEKNDLTWFDINEVYTPVDNQKVFYQQPAIWSAIYKKSILDKYDIRFLETPGASYQDTSFAFKTYSVAARFMMIEDAFLHYRIDNENSSVNSSNKIFCVCDEFAEIIRFCKAHEIYDELKYLIPKVQLICYKWNFNRLNSEFKLDFLKRWGTEYKNYFRAGLITRKYFSLRDLKKIIIISFFPFVYRNRIKL